MINLVINFRTVFQHLVPQPIRGTKLVNWLGSLLEPIQSLNFGFDAAGTVIRYDLSFNGQVIYLEHVLNDQFDPGDRSIYIDDPGDVQIVTPYVFNQVEQQPPLYLYNIADAMDNEDNVVLYNQGELGAITNEFIVHVPEAIFNDATEALMRVLIDKYRIAGKRYSFETF